MTVCPSAEALGYYSEGTEGAEGARARRGRSVNLGNWSPMLIEIIAAVSDAEVQKGSEDRDPYYGKEMATCGEIKK